MNKSCKGFLIFALCLTGFGLAGCQTLKSEQQKTNDSENSSSETVSNESDQTTQQIYPEADDLIQTTPVSQSYTLSAFAALPETNILYCAEESTLGKSSYPYHIILLRDNKGLIFDNYDRDSALTWGDLSKMSDEEIISYVEDNMNEDNSSGWHDVGLKVYTDDSGNKPEFEVLGIGGPFTAMLFGNYSPYEFDIYTSTYKCYSFPENKSSALEGDCTVFRPTTSISELLINSAFDEADNLGID